MDRSVGKLHSGYGRAKSSLSLLPRSLLSGIKSVINYFVVTDEDLVQAGVFLGYFHSDQIEDPGSPLNENGDTIQVN